MGGFYPFIGAFGKIFDLYSQETAIAFGRDTGRGGRHAPLVHGVSREALGMSRPNRVGAPIG